MASSVEAIAAHVISNHEGKHIVPAIIGTWTACFTQGIMMMQFWKWLKYSSRSDPLGTQCIVYFDVVVCTASAVLLLATRMHTEVYSYGTYSAYFEVPWQAAPSIFQFLTRIATAAYLIHRTWILSSSITILLINIALTLAYAAVHMWDYILLLNYTFGSVPDYTPTLIWSSLKVAGSIFITATMMWYFFKSRTGWQSTDQLLTKLSLLVIQTQLPPTIIAVIFIILTLVNTPDGPSPYALLFLCEPHIVAISILVLLNSRHKLAKTRSVASAAPSIPLQPFKDSRLGSGNIKVTTETTWRNDDGHGVFTTDKGMT